MDDHLDSDDSGLNEDELGDDDDDDIVEYIEINQEPLNDDDGVAAAAAAAAGGIVDEDDEGNAEAITDDADLVFPRHSGSVFCCDLEPTTGQLAVSGGQDDRAFVWSTTDGQILFECTEHKDSVTSCCFNPNGKLLATGDMSGIVQVWNIQERTKIWSCETSDLSWLRWHSGDPRVLLAGTSDGDCWMWLMPDGDCHILTGPGVANECAVLLPDGKRLAAGYGDGTVRIWNLSTRSTIHTCQGDGVGHNGGVTCIDSHTDDTLIISGSVDGTAKLINANNGKVLKTLDCKPTEDEDTESANSVESVGFCSSLPIFATATLKGQLDIWDISAQTCRQRCKQESGIVKLIWDHHSPLLYTAGTDGTLRLWDARIGNITAQWTGHSDEILDFVLSRDGNSLLTASDDKTCRLFHINKPDR